ncbi:MAG: PHP domain-containing protein [Coriobacteriaceae bacterium]|nr:PHP domain-containing protein [Coriobacteriaceae bacterium]
MAYRILGDVHTHTLFSRHAYSTIAENVAAAKAAGLELLGSTDHFSCMLFPEQHVRNFQYFINAGIWPREWDGVTLLHGCEADIVGIDGKLFGQDIPVSEDITGRPLLRKTTLYNRATGAADYVIASVHNGDFARDCTVAQVTDMYLGALEQSKVFILGHTGRSGLEFDIDAVLTCAKEKHKLIEINEHSLESSAKCHGVCRRIAERAAELGVGIAVSSDAHLAMQIGKYPEVLRMLEEIDFPEELIMNRGCEPFLRELAASGVCEL